MINLLPIAVMIHLFVSSGDGKDTNEIKLKNLQRNGRIKNM